MGGIRVEIQEPVNVLSTMLLTLTGGPKDAKLHPIGEHALEHTKPFRNHPSLGWLRNVYRPTDLVELYGYVAQLSGPLSFTPRSLLLPAYIASYEPKRMKELPSRMASFYADAKLGMFRREHNAAYTLMAAEVKDAVENARIEEFLDRLYGPLDCGLVVVPVPTHPWSGGGVGASTGRDDIAFLFPPRIPPDSSDPVAWSLDPEATQVDVQHELSRALLQDAMRENKDLPFRLNPLFASIPSDIPFARAYPDPDVRFAELFIRGSSVSYLRRTRGDEAAQRWMDNQIRRTGSPLVRNFFNAIERYLEGRWSTLDTFLRGLPKVLGA